METRISLAITVPDDSACAQVALFVGRWDGPNIRYACTPYRGEVGIIPLDPDHSVYPYAVTALRDSADRCIAELLEHIARGTEMLMHKVPID